MHKRLKELLEALERLGCKPQQRVGDISGRKYIEWIAPCPVHPDGSHVLRISETSEGGWTFYLDGKGSCDPELIVSQLHRVLPEQFPRPYFVDPAAEAVIKALAEQEFDGRRPFTTEYTDADGAPVAYVLRWNTPKGPVIRTIARRPEGWVLGEIPPPRPLYNLLRILSPQVDIVFVVKGEFAADLLRDYGCVATTCIGGADEAHLTDWTPLRGRIVCILPDNDDTGKHYAKVVAKHCWEAGAVSVRLLDLRRFARRMRKGHGIEHVCIFRDRLGLPLGEARTLGEWLLGVAKRLPDWKPGVVAPLMRCSADVICRPIEWLWPKRIPLGRLSFVVGLPGSGKGLLTIDMAARVTTGRAWPDGSPCPHGNVLLLNAVDGLADVVRGRAEAAGADLMKLGVLLAVRRVREDGQRIEVPVSLANIDAIAKAIERIKPLLVVFDPIELFIPAEVNIDAGSDARIMLGQLAQLAKQFQTAIVLVTCREKVRAEFPNDKALGARAFVGVSRSVWHICLDPDNSKRRLFIGSQTNLGFPANGLAFQIKGGLNAHPSLEWESAPISMTTDQALAREYGIVDMVTFLEAQREIRLALTYGPRFAKDIMAELKAEGFSDRAIQRALASLGVKSRKCPYSGKREWYLPEAVKPKNPGERRKGTEST